jgi:hypothetical protein
MKSHWLGGLTILLLMAISGRLGFLAARPFAAATLPPDDALRIRFRAGEDGLFGPVPNWEGWQYPGSKSHSSITGAGHDANGVRFGATEWAVLTTADDFEKVCAYYKKKGELRHPGIGNYAVRMDSGGSGRDFFMTVFENKYGNWLVGPEESDAADAMGFTVSSLRYQLAGFVHRRKGEHGTCIMLVYRPLPEFISVAKLLQG